MGSVISTAAEKTGGFLGAAFTAPFRAIFSRSCEGKCGGAWDLLCFIENGCGASLVRLFLAYILAIITGTFLYVFLWKTGLLKCLVKKSFKIPWKAFWGCFRGLVHACARVGRKVRDTRRVYRAGRGPPLDTDDDVEMGRLGWSGGGSTDDETSVWGRRRARAAELGWSETDWSSGSVGGVGRSGSSRKRWRSPVSVRERRKDRLRQPATVRRLTTGKEVIVVVEHPAKRGRVETRSLHHARHHHHRATGMRRTEEEHVVHGSTRPSLQDHGREHLAREH